MSVDRLTKGTYRIRLACEKCPTSLIVTMEPSARLVSFLCPCGHETPLTSIPAPMTPTAPVDGWPEKIYLQRHEDCVEHGCDGPHEDGTTWCADKIHSGDVEYVRADVARLAATASGDRVKALEAFIQTVAVPVKDDSWKEVMHGLSERARAILKVTP